MLQTNEVSIWVEAEKIIAASLELFINVVVEDIVYRTSKVKRVVYVYCLSKWRQSVAAFYLKFALIDVGENQIEYFVFELAYFLLASSWQHNQRSNELLIVERVELVLYEVVLILWEGIF